MRRAQPDARRAGRAQAFRFSLLYLAVLFLRRRVDRLRWLSDRISRRADRRHRRPSSRRKQRGRNIALLVVLVALAVLFFAMTIVKLGGQLTSRGMAERSLACGA